MDTKTILLVTNDDNFACLFMREAADEFFFTEWIKDSVLFVEMLKNNSYHVVVIEECSDEPNPFTLLRRMKLLGFSAPTVVTFRGEPKADEILLAYELGAFDAINRSSSLQELISDIKNM